MRVLFCSVNVALDPRQITVNPLGFVFLFTSCFFCLFCPSTVAHRCVALGTIWSENNNVPPTKSVIIIAGPSY